MVDPTSGYLSREGTDVIYQGHVWTPAGRANVLEMFWSDNRNYVNYDTATVYVNCVQCDGERLAAPAVHADTDLGVAQHAGAVDIPF